VSVWPGRPGLTGDISRFIAREGRVFVLAASGVLRRDDVPDAFFLKEPMFGKREIINDGGSLIMDPRGELLAGPLLDEEGLVSAEIDLRVLREERQNFDPAGHYSRPDVFSFSVNRRRLESVQFD